MQENNITYIVEEVIEEATDVVTLKLHYEGKVFSCRAGQFITVFFPETGHMEGKSYSISGIYAKNTFSITVRGVGVFSYKLIAKKVGDTINASLPYGYFYSESETSSLVMVTGGIGIAPFRSIIIDSLLKNPKRKIELLYVNKTEDSLIFRKEFNELSKKYQGNFTVHYYLTQESLVKDVKQGRISIEDITEASKNSSDVEFFICGPISFVRDYWKGLKTKGVAEETIYTEAFF